MLTKTAKKELVGIYYLIPSVIFMVGLMLYPLIHSVYLSFHNQALYEFVPTFAGLDNYVELFASARFWASVKKTLVWAVGTVGMQITLGIGAALLLNHEFKGRAFARTAVLLPFFIPSISACLVFRWMYNDISGLFNYILISLGIIRSPVPWLAKESTGMFAVVMVGVWRFFPFVMINVLARLETIPQQLYDAARVDGAGRWQSFLHITLPQVRAVLLIVILVRWIFMFNKFDVIWILTEGGPVRATETLPILAYETGFLAMRMGKAATITTMLLLILVTVMLIYLTIFKPTKTEA